LRPFPFDWLPRYTRDEVALARAVLRRLLPASAPPGAREALGPRWRALLGARVEAWPLAPALATPADLRARFGGVALAAVMAHRALGAMAAMIDTPFALTLAARALGADEEDARRSAAARTFTPAHEGALAMLCAQAAALACAPSPPPVVRAVTDDIDDVREALGTGAMLVWPWRVAVGMDAGEVALVLDAQALARAAEIRGDGRRAVAEVEVEVALVAARAALPAEVVAALAPGDVLALEGGVAFDVDTGALSGEMMLAAGDAEVPVTVAGGTVVVRAPARARRSSVSTEDDRAPGETTAPQEGPVVRDELLATLPVEVEVVVARGEFSVAEVGAWRVGEVVAFPSRIGDAVVVRAGGRVVARGELCDVEGEVGVRITEVL
jgi:flagellar motor switch/type III secretory pathway protein FliN